MSDRDSLIIAAQRLFNQGKSVMVGSYPNSNGCEPSVFRVVQSKADIATSLEEIQRFATDQGHSVRVSKYPLQEH